MTRLDSRGYLLLDYTGNSTGKTFFMALIKEIDSAPETCWEKELKNLDRLYEYVDIHISIPLIGKLSRFLIPSNT